jgi:hypothetical protein
MRAIFSHAIARRPATDTPWAPGLPHAAAALATWPVWGGTACVAGLLMAALVSFVVWLPLVALALNEGRPLEPLADAPTLTPRARIVLFAAWTATAWLAAAVARG